MTLRSTFATCSLALVMTASAQAQTLVTGADTKVIINAARQLGDATFSTQGNGDPLINGTIDGLSYQILFRNCTDNANCEDLTFYLGFEVKAEAEIINDWNYNYRFSRAYLDKDRDACVEMDLDLLQGVTPEYLAAQFDIWGLIVTQFPEHIGYY